MTPPICVPDACVLYSASLRDLFMWLALAEIYFPKWTEQIHAEWIESVLKNRPDLTREKLERTRQLMNLHAEGSLVEDYEPLISTLSLPDEKDRHVLAAAIQSYASVIVTFNLSDFPRQALEPYGIQAQHPDAFLCDRFGEEPELFLNALQEMIAQLKNPPRTFEQHLDYLRAQGLKRIADLLAKRLQENTTELWSGIIAFTGPVVCGLRRWISGKPCKRFLLSFIPGFLRESVIAQ